jgi:hypothetical protein
MIIEHVTIRGGKNCSSSYLVYLLADGNLLMRDDRLENGLNSSNEW